MLGHLAVLWLNITACALWYTWFYVHIPYMHTCTYPPRLHRIDQHRVCAVAWWTFARPRCPWTGLARVLSDTPWSADSTDRRLPLQGHSRQCSRIHFPHAQRTIFNRTLQCRCTCTWYISGPESCHAILTSNANINIGHYSLNAIKPC